MFLFVAIFRVRRCDIGAPFSKINCHKSGNGIFSCAVSIMLSNSMTV